jgi:hypothetical protein
MCLITEEIEKRCKGVPGSETIFRDWLDERMKILETLPFEKIEFALSEIDRRFKNFLEYAKEFS